MTADRESRIGARGSLVVLTLWLLLPALAVGLACRGKENPSRQERRGAAESPEPQESNPPRRSRPVFQERIGERRQMVMRQIQGREITDPNVLEAMRTVPRHVFVPAAEQAYAYEDGPLPIGYGQTISQPYVVAFMTEALQLDPNSVVLEIGTGSGYQAAVCAEIARTVYTIEIVEPLARSAARRLEQLGYQNIHVKVGDGYFGWAEKGPFDAILGTAAAGAVPPPLLEQLNNGGRMILPVVGDDGFQYLILWTKDQQGRLQNKNVLPVRFVPMTGVSTTSAGPGAAP